MRAHEADPTFSGEYLMRIRHKGQNITNSFVCWYAIRDELFLSGAFLSSVKNQIVSDSAEPWLDDAVKLFQSKTSVEVISFAKAFDDYNLGEVHGIVPDTYYPLFFDCEPLLVYPHRRSALLPVRNKAFESVLLKIKLVYDIAKRKLEDSCYPLVVRGVKISGWMSMSSILLLLDLCDMLGVEKVVTPPLATKPTFWFIFGGKLKAPDIMGVLINQLQIFNSDHIRPFPVVQPKVFSDLLSKEFGCKVTLGSSEISIDDPGNLPLN
jgi:hypothetical protein